MKNQLVKLSVASATLLAFLAKPFSVFADVDISIQPPRAGQGGINPNVPVGRVISNVITIIFAVAIISVLLMLVIGAFNWITSGGDKEAVGKARQRIINALIGLVVLAVAFLITNVAGQLVNIDIFNLRLPSIDKP